MFVSFADAGMIDALLKRAYKWSFSKDIVTLCKLLNKSGTSLFHKMHFPSHRLNPLPPYKKDNLARSAKVAERAICFTDRNFYLFFSFLARSAKLPEGYIFYRCFFDIFFLFFF